MNHLFFPNELLMPNLGRMLKEGHNVILRAIGFSMRPFVENNRDSIIISPCRPEEVRKGDVVLAEFVPRRYAVHRVIRCYEDGRIVLRGDGNAYGVEKCHRANIMGRVSGFYRKGRKKPDLVEGRKWRIYSRLWPDSPFLRRILLGVYRRIWLKLFPPRYTVYNPRK